jgi:hypothetical protein
MATYCRKLDKENNPMDNIPQDGDDHLMDAMAYAVTYYKQDEVLALF